MDNESQYSGYSYKSSHSRSSRKHRWVKRVAHKEATIVNNGSNVNMYRTHWNIIIFKIVSKEHPLTQNIYVFVFRDRRDRHRSKSRDSSSRGDKSVTIQTPGEPLLDAESTRGDDRVSHIGFI